MGVAILNFFLVDLVIYLNLIFTILQFEISSLMNRIFILFQTWILQATAGRKKTVQSTL